MSALAWFGRVRRATLMTNLHAAFPSMPEEEIRFLARRSVRNLATVFLEIPLLRHLDDARLHRAITFEGIELLTTDAHRGLILLSGHYGNWELLALAAGSFSGVPVAIIVKDQNDFGHIDRMRISRGNSVIRYANAARDAMTILLGGGCVALLADQSAAPPDPTVTFFGLETCFFGTPARLALRFRPRVLTGFAVRNEAGGYHVVIEELAHDDLEDTPSGRVAFTQRYAAVLERAIRRHPDLWMWTHRRWKYTPGITYDGVAPDRPPGAGAR